jgi:chain length determinant protein EpsF
MTLNGLLLALRARYVLIWTTCLACAVAAFGVSMLLPKKFTSTCQVLIDVVGANSVLGRDASWDASYALLAPSYMATQADIVASPRVVDSVVRLLGLDQNEDSLREWHEKGDGEGTAATYFAKKLNSRVDVKPGRDSNVLSISYTDKNPQFAAAVANAYAKAYKKTNVELRAAPAQDFAAWFDARAQQARQRLDEAQQRLSAYEKDHGVVASEERSDVESTRLAELDTQLTTAQAMRAESASREEHSATGAQDPSPDVQQNPTIVSLRTDVARAQAKLNELSLTLGSNNPRYQQAQSELETLQSALSTEVSRAKSGVAATNAINAQREAKIRAAVEGQKQRVLGMRAQHDEMALLQRDVDSARRAYDLITQRLLQTSLEGQANSTNIVVLSEAVPSTTASSPNVWLNTASALLLGALFGGALALAAELRRPRIRSTEDVTQALSVPVLAILPAARPPQMISAR